MRDGWMTADELAALRLSRSDVKALGMRKWPESPQGINGRAVIDGWEGRKIGSSQAWEYRISSLPALVQKAAANSLIKITPAQLPTQLSLDLPDAASLKTYQRDTMDARNTLLTHIDQMILLTGISQGKAVNALVGAAAKGDLSPELQRLIPVANARSNGTRSLTRSTIYNWIKARMVAAGNVVALAPASVPEADIPEWADTFMTFWGRPMQPGMAEILDDLWPEGVVKPSYDQVRRFLKRLDPVTLNRGRMGPKALQQLRAFKARDVSELWPGCVFIGDGHTYKERVGHPISGQPFRPEVTSILDVFTRRWVGWSVALSENTWAVADALRHAMTTATCCDIFYYDNGSGSNNKTWDDDCVGMVARLGIKKINSAPWISQARGVIERFHSSVLHRVARRSISYVGQRMDDEAKRQIFKKTEADIKASGKSKLLPLWSDFIAEMEAAQVEYNDRPHSFLPRIIDATTGKRRHMTPNEAWAKAIVDGWTPDPLSEELARDLFRPAVRRKTNRALVNWIGNEYYHPDLEPLHGTEVSVAYDIHDASKVSVSLLDGRWVCDAIWNGHKTSYVPVTMAQHIHDERQKGRLERVDKRRDAVLASAKPQLVIEHQPETPFSVDQLAEAALVIDHIAAPFQPAETKIGTNERPRFQDDLAWVKWLIENPERVTDKDRELLRQQLRNSSFRTLIEWEGVAATTLQDLINQSIKAA